MPKVGILTCPKNWHKGCPGIGSHVLCFDAINQQHGPLGNLPGATISTFEYCKGCPGDSMSAIAQNMVQNEGIEVVALASCLFIQEVCPHIWEVVNRIQSTVDCQLLLGTFWEPLSLPYHHPAGKPRLRAKAKRQAAIRSFASKRR